jgi:FkbM family methyltransferase
MVKYLIRKILGQYISNHDLHLISDIFSQHRLQSSPFLTDADNARRKCLNSILNFTLVSNPQLIAETQSQHLQELFIYTLLNGKISTYLEAGANDGVSFSNTYGLMKTTKASGILVEADPSLYQACSQNRPFDTCLSYALSDKSKQLLDFDLSHSNTLFRSLAKLDAKKSYLDSPSKFAKVQSITLEDVLSIAGLDSIDFLSLDIEGAEISALRSCKTSFFTCALVEANNKRLANLIINYLTDIGFKCYRYPFASNEVLAISDLRLCNADFVRLLESFFQF